MQFFRWYSRDNFNGSYHKDLIDLNGSVVFAYGSHQLCRNNFYSSAPSLYWIYLFFLCQTRSWFCWKPFSSSKIHSEWVTEFFVTFFPLHFSWLRAMLFLLWSCKLQNHLKIHSFLPHTLRVDFISTLNTLCGSFLDSLVSLLQLVWPIWLYCIKPHQFNVIPCFSRVYETSEGSWKHEWSIKESACEKIKLNFCIILNFIATLSPMHSVVAFITAVIMPTETSLLLNECLTKRKLVIHNDKW